MSVLQEAGHIKNTVVLTFQHIQCLHLMYSQVQQQIILDPDYFPDYLSVSYDYDFN